MAAEKLVTGRMFLEGPRWYEGALYVSDMHADEVLKISPQGDVEAILSVSGQPSGLGWLPCGDMLVVSMTDRKLLRVAADGSVTVHADLSGHIAKRANDMVVDAFGRAYIGNFGFDFDAGEAPAPTVLLCVDLEGQISVVAEDMMFPNGMVITPHGRRLIVAETFRGELTEFDINADGTLKNRRTFAKLPEGAVPDGICYDEDGGVWVASPTTKETLRVVSGGEVTHRISTGDRQSIACMLGGVDGKTLFILTSETTHREECRAKKSAEILTLSAPFAGAGWP